MLPENGKTIIIVILIGFIGTYTIGKQATIIIETVYLNEHISKFMFFIFNVVGKIVARFNDRKDDDENSAEVSKPDN